MSFLLMSAVQFDGVLFLTYSFDSVKLYDTGLNLGL